LRSVLEVELLSCIVPIAVLRRLGPCHFSHYHEKLAFFSGDSDRLPESLISEFYDRNADR